MRHNVRYTFTHQKIYNGVRSREGRNFEIIRIKKSRGNKQENIFRYNFILCKIKNHLANFETMQLSSKLNTHQELHTMTIEDEQCKMTHGPFLGH
jgi:hypothetical protein